MKDTSLPSSSISSDTVVLQRSLESRLRLRLAAGGSPIYGMRSTHWDMPSGPPIFALRASAPRTGDSVSSSARAFEENLEQVEVRVPAFLTGWQTPLATDGENRLYVAARGTSMALRLPGEAHLVTRTRFTRDGEYLTGSTARMRAGARLSPAHTRWLMGFPAAWCESAVMGMLSFPS